MSDNFIKPRAISDSMKLGKRWWSPAGCICICLGHRSFLACTSHENSFVVLLRITLGSRGKDPIRGGPELTPGADVSNVTLEQIMQNTV
jgi:hypothetical protein